MGALLWLRTQLFNAHTYMLTCARPHTLSNDATHLPWQVRRFVGGDAPALRRSILGAHAVLQPTVGAKKAPVSEILRL